MSEAPAKQKVLAQMDVIELNEAFAEQGMAVLACCLTTPESMLGAT